MDTNRATSGREPLYFLTITGHHMTKETTVIHNRIPLELDEFIERQADTARFHNKTHVVINALMELKDQLEPDPLH